MRMRPALVRASSAFVASLVALWACSNSDLGDGPPVGTDAGSEPPPSESDAQAGVDAAPPEGSYTAPPGFTEAQADEAAVAPSTFVREGTRIVSTSAIFREVRRLAAGEPIDAESDDPLDHLRIEASFPGDYAAGVRINTSGRPNAYVDVVPIGASHADARVRSDGSLVAFGNVRGNVTSAFGASDTRVEEFIAIPSAADVAPLQYRLARGPQLERWEELAGDLYAFATDGKALYRLGAPIAIDAADKRIAGTWKIDPVPDGWTITAQLDLTTAAFPVLVDPAFDTPEWFPDRSADTAIAPRAGAIGVFDSNDRCNIIFSGGGSNFTLLADLYARCATITGNQWVKVTTTSAPTPRAYSACAWNPLYVDPGSGTAGGGYLFGGYLGQAGLAAQNDLWIGANTAQVWTQINNPGTVPWPSKRLLHGMAWTGSTDKSILLFGGVDIAGNNLTDTWKFNPTTATWTQSCTACFPSLYGFATARLGTEAAPAIYVVGGNDGTNMVNSVYKWTGTTWQLQAIANDPYPTTATGAVETVFPTPASDLAPTPRDLAWAARTPSNNLLWGSGDSSTTAMLYDAWFLNVGTTAWRRLATPDPAVPPDIMLPGFRESASAFYDDNLGEMVLVGGLTDLTSNTAVTVSGRRYIGRNDSATMTVKCVDKNSDGKCATAGTDQLTLTASVVLNGATNSANAQAYFLTKTGSVWTEIGGTCGTAATPRSPSGGTISCTATYTGATQALSVRARDKSYYTGGSNCATTPTNDTTAYCNRTAYSGVSICPAFPATFNNAATVNCP